MSEICPDCGANVRAEGHVDVAPGVWCPVMRRSLDSPGPRSSLRPLPRTDHDDGRVGVKHQAASSAVTYTTKARGGCRLRVDPALLKPGAGTMTRAEYLEAQGA